MHHWFGSKQATDGSQQTTASSLPNFHGCNMDNNDSKGAAIVRQILDNPWWRGGQYDPALYGYYDCITQRPPTKRNDTGAIQTPHQAAARRAISSPVPIRRIMPQASLTVPLRGKMAVPRLSTWNQAGTERAVGQTDSGRVEPVTPKVWVINSDSGSTTSTPESLRWTAPMESEFLNLYVCKFALGKKSDSGFPDSSHDAVAHDLRWAYLAVNLFQDLDIFKKNSPRRSEKTMIQ